MNEYVNTGFKDCDKTSIYVGDIIQEGCNGLISIVEWNQKRGSFWLKNLGEGYGIENASIEWKVLNSESKDSPMYHKGKDIVLSV